MINDYKEKIVTDDCFCFHEPMPVYSLESIFNKDDKDDSENDNNDKE